MDLIFLYKDNIPFFVGITDEVHKVKTRTFGNIENNPEVHAEIFLKKSMGSCGVKQLEINYFKIRVFF
jgi:hypothetical protein